VERASDPHNARRKQLQVTKLGVAVLREREGIFDQLPGQWAQRIGSAVLRTLEKHQSKLAGISPVRLDDTGWLSRGLGEFR
jgi:hypothetical protein